MPSRRKAREVALQIVFKDDFNPENISSDREFILSRLGGDADLTSWAMSLVSGVRQNLDEIDGQLGPVLKNWDLQRVFAADRNIVRLAAYELLYTDTDRGIVINEAIELAKRYGHERSYQFVNGVLDRLADRVSDTTKSAAR